MRIFTPVRLAATTAILTLAATPIAIHAFQSSGATPPVELTREEDQARTMKLLGITQLRRGANGSNPDADNYANYDEATANPYPNLPDPMVMNDGTPVRTANDWWQRRRPEIVELFDREIYGRMPANTPDVDWEVVSTTREDTGGYRVLTKRLVGHVDNSSYPLVNVDIDLSVSTPLDADGPVPVIMEFGFLPALNGDDAKGKGKGKGPAAKGKGPDAKGKGKGPSGPTWQQMALAKGWGYATIVPNSIQADNGAGLTRGIIGLMNHGQPRAVDDWGSLRAWGWGASRALDYFETDPAVDATKVGIEGHSRYGKATAVAMADDPRFAIAFVSSSGEGGLSVYRRNWGELVENVAAVSEYHWMAGNFLKYAAEPLTWNDLPIDAHELVALAAPRPVFISGGSVEKGDGWVDAKGMFMAGEGASPVYELLGKKGLQTDVYPGIGPALMDGDISFRQHEAGHTPAPNWPVFLDWAERYLND